MKTTEKNLLEILLGVLLFIAIGMCVHSCVECEKKIDGFFKQTQNEPTIIREYEDFRY